MKGEMPPRGRAFDNRRMMLVFDVDCGELVPGHHFIARGLGGPFRTSTLDRWNGEDPPDAQLMAEFEDIGGYPAFTLEYELVPGVSTAEGEGNFFRFLVDISYHADVELPWYPNDGGAIAAFEGGDATHGFRGDWPLPPDAAVLTFAIAGVNADGFADHENPAGDLVVDVVRGNAAWRPL
jgi:hypothetical protein